LPNDAYKREVTHLEGFGGHFPFCLRTFLPFGKGMWTASLLRGVLQIKISEPEDTDV
jgi:hypothetical protein